MFFVGSDDNCQQAKVRRSIPIRFKLTARLPEKMRDANVFVFGLQVSRVNTDAPTGLLLHVRTQPENSPSE
jgi:hypothetical protein